MKTSVRFHEYPKQMHKWNKLNVNLEAACLKIQYPLKILQTPLNLFNMRLISI